jgi:sugar lactone lactonase YvrE
MLGCSGRTKQQNAENDASTEPGMPAWSLEELWKSDTLMRTCESVRFDEERKQLYVACINGSPWERDGQGFIGLLNLDGSLKTERWVTGLDCPKGMVVLDGLLYVADLDQIVVIDIEQGNIKKRFPVPDAAQLNDIAIDGKGKIYFSDSGTGWIWTMENDKPEPWIQGDWKRPNGLYVEKERVLVTSSGSRDLTVVSLEDESKKVVTTEIGHGDGVEFTGKEGHYIVTSWAGEIFLVLPDFSKISLLKTSDQEINSADIAINIAEQTLYVPTFFNNRVVAYKLVHR